MVDSIVRTQGRADGPAHVLLHGCPGRSAEWDEVVARGGGARVITVDLPDFGSAPEAPHDVAALERSADALVGSIDAPSLVLAGVSFGGWLAARVAERQPERVSRVVAVSAFPRLTREDAALREELLVKLRSRAMSRSELVEACVALLAGTESNERARMSIRESLEHITNTQWERHLLRAVSLAEPAYSVESIPVGATVVHARRDACVPFELGEELASLGERCELVPVDTDAHLLQVTHPELVASMVFAG